MIGRITGNQGDGAEADNDDQCVPYADKTRAASAEAQRKPEVKAKQVVVQQMAQNRPEVKAKHCEASNRPEVKARRSAAQRLAQNRPEVKAKQSASQKGVICIAGSERDRLKTRIRPVAGSMPS